MHSDLIGKIEKARRYAEEPERITINELNARFRGGNNDHTITLTDGHWACDCDFFHLRRTCAHVMALQKILHTMLTADARDPYRSMAEEQITGSLG